MLGKDIAEDVVDWFETDIKALRSANRQVWIRLVDIREAISGQRSHTPMNEALDMRMLDVFHR